MNSLCKYCGSDLCRGECQKPRAKLAEKNDLFRAQEEIRMTMAEKCKRCGGTGDITRYEKCPDCDGTGIDLSTCEGVPPGSGAEDVLMHWPSRTLHTRDQFDGEHYCRARFCSVTGIRFPSHEVNGVRVPDDPDAGRYWRRR